jgi:hypothetical protein
MGRVIARSFEVVHVKLEWNRGPAVIGQNVKIRQ